jgi:glycerol-3-phosphate dehydrogenase
MPHAFPLRRDVASLRGRRFDLLVIGGGIYGAWIACDAAQRGLSVALIEKNDWACGTSSASSKLIHGGLRYLEHFEFSLVRHALAERRVLSRIAPHLVRPLDFAIPVWKGARVGRWQLQAGLALYDLLASGRQPVDRYRSLSRAQLAAAYPYLRAEGLRGGLRYGDCQEDDARMTLCVVAAAQAAGAVCANRVEALALLDGAGEIRGARVRDATAAEEFDLDAACVVNAAGPWAAPLLAGSGIAPPPVKLIKGVHLVLPDIEPPPGQPRTALLLTAPQDGRVIFVIPWYGRTLVGTTESNAANADAAQVSPADADYLLDAVEALLPALHWRGADVIASFAGVRTLQDGDGDDLSAVSREFTILEPRPGLVWPLGGKYTTARHDGAEVVDRVLARLGRTGAACATGERSLPGAPADAADAAGFGDWQAGAMAALQKRGIDAQAARWLTLRHGARTAAIERLCDENPAWTGRLHAEAPFVIAEAVLAVREEMAHSVDDVLRRRMPLNLLVRDAAAARTLVESILSEAKC